MDGSGSSTGRRVSGSTSACAVTTCANSRIDACEKGFGGCAADLDGDGEVGASDLSRMLDDWGDAPKGSNADLDGDGAVGAPDLSLLLAAWGVCG